MDRMEEYEALRRELEETPPALAFTLGRARARKRRSRWGRGLGIPAGSLAAAFAAFVLLVNVSTPFALACSNVPILKELTAAVAFSPSLRAAVEHDFVQYIGQTRTQNGITMTLDYLIPDHGQLIFFATVTGPEEAESFMVRPKCTDAAGAELEGFASTSHSIEPGVLSDAFALMATDAAEPILPDVLYLECEVEGRLSRGDDGAPPAPLGQVPDEPVPDETLDAVFTFEFPLESALTGEGETVEVGRWMELDGNRIYVDALEIYPTHARLSLEEDPANAETLQSVEFYLEDEKGNRYASGATGSSVSAMGNSYWCESPFFARPERLTLHMTQADWLEKGREYVTIDLEKGEALDPLPPGVSVRTRRVSDTQAELAFIAPEPPESTEHNMVFYQVAYTSYRTPEGEERNTGGVSTYRTERLWFNTPDEVELPEGFFVEEFLLEDYPWDTVEWKLYLTRRTTFDTPVSLALQ